jgi:hypothetical protein
MRGTGAAAGSLFSYVDVEERIPGRHPLRKVRQVVNDVLSGAVFGAPELAGDSQV